MVFLKPRRRFEIRVRRPDISFVVCRGLFNLGQITQSLSDPVSYLSLSILVSVS